MTTTEQTLQQEKLGFNLQALRPWLVVLSASLLFFYEFIQFNMTSSLEPELMRDFHLNAQQYGFLSAADFIANCLFLFPAGYLLDRLSARRLLITAMALCAGGTLLFALTSSFTLAWIFRFVTGLGAAFCLLSAVRVATRWFPPHRMGLVTGVIVTMAFLGGMLSQAPFTALILKYGWRHAVLLDAALGFAIMLVIWQFVVDFPPGYKQAENLEKISDLGFWQSFRQSILRFQNWFAGSYASLVNLPVFILGAVWGSAYLTQIHHIPRTEAAAINSMLYLGTILGSPFAGWVSDKIRRRRSPMMFGAIVSLAIILMIVYAPNVSVLGYTILFFLLGFTSSTQVISYPTVAENNPKALTAMAVSVVSFSCVAGGAIFQPITGWLMDIHWDGAMLNGIPVYTAADYNFGFIVLPIGYILSLVIAFLIKETFCKSID